MKQRLFRVTYTWRPKDFGYPEPPGGIARSATVVYGVTKGQVLAEFARKHPHCKPQTAQLAK
jgi:hypothetical protein